MPEGYFSDGGDVTCASMISAALTLAVAIGGSMLWVRWTK
jgi:hypothetical protein